jgi:hypothetical protein
VAETDEEDEFLDFYDDLGVDWKASDREIRDSYIALNRELRPAADQGDKVAEERLKMVTEAYDTLGNPERRRQYDLPQPEFDNRSVDFGVVVRGVSVPPVRLLLRNLGRRRYEPRVEYRGTVGSFWHVDTDGEVIWKRTMVFEMEFHIDIASDEMSGPQSEWLTIDFEGVPVSVNILADIVDHPIGPEPDRDDFPSPSPASVPGGSHDARNRYRKADGDARRRRSGGRPASTRPTRPKPRATSPRRIAPPGKSARKTPAGRRRTGSVRSVVKHAYRFSLAYAVTVAVIGGLVALVAGGIANGIFVNLHHVQSGATNQPAYVGIAVGVLAFLVFAIFWYARMWRLKYHERVSEQWRSGPLGPAGTICILFLTTLGTVLISPFILLGIALGMVQYD